MKLVIKKETNHKYGKLPAKEAEAIPWERLSVDLMGPYKIIIEGHDDSLIIKSLTTENSQANSIL